MKFWAVRFGSIGLAVLVSFGIGMIAQGSSGTVSRLLALAGLYVTLAVSLNLINGITGQFSIGHAAFYQVGSYTAAFLASILLSRGVISNLGTPIPWVLVAVATSLVTAGIAGLFIGLPSLRLRGDYLAIVTLGFGEILRIVIQNTPQLGGSYGINSPKAFVVPYVWMLTFLCVGVCRNLLQTAHGLSFLSVREDEVASSAMGVNVTRVKVAAFVIGSAFAGAAGALLTFNEGFINVNSFTMDVSFIILTMVVLGGTGSVTGSIVAALTLFILPEVLRDAPAMPLNAVLGTLAGIALLVGTIRLAMDHKGLGRSIWMPKTYIGIGIAVAGGIVVSVLANCLPALANRTIPSAELRMVIFSAVLVIMMLLRPQGIFGVRELGLKSFFRRANA
ncbi:MAG: branched-chain amino acid ABC transporter permease [Fimbriimonadaceae bacterium]|nr:branched-chain amino acid ABC transporter permease [Fimbriimonadaceae bacterium]